MLNSIKKQAPVYDLKNYSEKIFGLLCPSQLFLIDNFIYFFNKHKDVYVTQTKLAGKYARETANRGIKKLVELGIITEKKRRFNSSCIYKLNPIFFDIDWRNKMIIWFKNLNFLSVNLLFGNGLTKENVTLRRVLKGKVNEYIKFMYINTILINGQLQNNLPINESPFYKKEWFGIRNLFFTLQGQMRVLAFPKEAIDFVHERLGSLPSNNQEYHFISSCAKYCVDKGIKPLWRLYYKMFEAHGDKIPIVRKEKVRKMEDVLISHRKFDVDTFEAKTDNRVTFKNGKTFQEIIRMQRPSNYDSFGQQPQKEEKVNPDFPMRRIFEEARKKESNLDYESQQLELALIKREKDRAMLRARGLIP